MTKPDPPPASALRRLAPVLILVAALVAYLNSFTGAFVFDDLPAILDNPHVRHLWPLSEALKVPADTTPVGRPVVSLSLAVNYALGGLDVRGYHVFNFAVHVLAALALYGIVRRTLSSDRLRTRFGDSASPLAVSVALIWVVHPLQTEAVTYIVQRAESLMGMFYLVTLYCFIRSAETGASRIWLSLCVAACALGMGTKEVMVTAPVVVLLYDRTFLSGSFREALRRHRVSYLGLAATWILLGYLVMTGGGLSHHAGENERAGWWAYALTETGVIVHYLRLAIWPEPLCLDYRWPITTNWPAMLPRAVVVAGLLGATVWACQRRLLWGFLGAWFFLILALTSSVFKLADPAFEHRMYLPLAAVVTLVVLGGFKLRERLAGCGQKFSRNIARGVVGVAVISLAALTVRRNHDYRSELAIWQDTILKRPNNPRVWSSLGTIALKSGDMESAARHLNEALRLKPDYAEAHHNLGLYFYRLGRVQEAVSHYEQALQFRPDLAVGHNNLGNLLVQTGKVREGIQHLKQALRLRPDYPEAYYNLGVAAAQTGKIAEAIGYYAQAVRLLPDYPEAHNNWASALLQLGKPAEALGHIEQALRLKPDYAEAQCNLALLYSRTGRIDDAIRVYEKVLQRKPDYAEAHCGLGILLAQTGKLAAATRHFEQAVLSKPDYADAHNNLGNALMLTGHAPEAIAHYEQALRIRPNYVDASNNLARARAALAGEPNQTK